MYKIKILGLLVAVALLAFRCEALRIRNSVDELALVDDLIQDNEYQYADTFNDDDLDLGLAQEYSFGRSQICRNKACKLERCKNNCPRNRGSKAKKRCQDHCDTEYGS